MALLEVDGLAVELRQRGKLPKEVVRGVSFDVGHGEAMGLVGETGAGKSVTARAVLGLLRPGMRVTAGTVRLKNRNLLGATRHEMRKLRGTELSFVAQNPFGVLNPILPLHKQFYSIAKAHGTVSGSESYGLAVNAVRKAGITDPDRVLLGYAHELSGGMAQRVVLGMALLLGPSLVVADEPTTALDVTVQRQILNSIRESIVGEGQSMLLITHDLGVVANYCDRVAVMLDGTIVETGAVQDVLARPTHEYTKQLIRAAAFQDVGLAGEGQQRSDASERTLGDEAEVHRG